MHEMARSRRWLLCCCLLVATIGHLHAVDQAEDEEVVPAQEGEVRRSLTVGEGFWSTNGSTIVDSLGNPVYFSGLNWGGFDAENCIVDGLWDGTGQKYDSMIRKMASLGFNLIRLAFAGTCVQKKVFPKKTAVNYVINSDLEGLTSLEVMEKVVKAAGDAGMRVILDYHRIEPTTAGGEPEDGLWYTEKHPVEFWLKTWELVTKTFKGNPTVVGVDLFNEPHDTRKKKGGHPGPFWDDNMTNPFNWRAAAKEAGDLILSIEPNWLICVQGMWNEAWWGGNLQPVKEFPLVYKVPHKLVYQIHDYGPIVSEQPWFDVPNFPNNLPAFWDSMWGFVHDEGIAPVWIGEFGSFHNTTVEKNSTDFELARNWKELMWLTEIVKYIEEKHFVWTWFTWGPNSRDTGGILQEGWKLVHDDKIALLQPIMFPEFSLQAKVDNTSSRPPPVGPLPPVGGGNPLSLSSPPMAATEAPPPPARSAAGSLATRGTQALATILMAVGWAGVLALSAHF